ncbi:DUF2933 domain-containing protein [Paenibacillus turpanensis]|uniref:DUF2933 domain-containing protein n=1 Tax=Paenibacillus turpanensis TaxID=2689078 RepID=UPI00140D5A2D|nr:DUF2933 domain-containing protein [Paenibacillus turpanensis]
MDWSFLALLACPLMMLLCMRGLFSGNKNPKDAAQTDAGHHEIQQLQIRMAELMEQNQKLMLEMEALKRPDATVVELDQQKRAFS